MAMSKSSSSVFRGAGFQPPVPKMAPGNSQWYVAPVNPKAAHAVQPKSMPKPPKAKGPPPTPPPVPMVPPPAPLPKTVDRTAVWHDTLQSYKDGTAQWLQDDWSVATILDVAPKVASKPKTEAELQEAKSAKRRRRKDRKAAEQVAVVPSSSEAAASGSSGSSAALVTYTGTPLPKGPPPQPPKPSPVEKVLAALDSSSDSDDIDYGKDPVVADQPKYQLDCTNAKECGAYTLLWSEFLLIEPTEGMTDASWAGKIWGQCQPCSGLSKGEFKRVSRRRREERSQALRGHRVRSSTMTLKTMRVHIKKILPGASHEQLRKLTYMRIRAIAAAFALAYEEANTWARDAYRIVIEEWKDTIRACAEDPSYSPSPDARTMSAEEASYFTEVMKGVYFSYLCRKKKCFSSAATMWRPG